MRAPASFDQLLRPVAELVDRWTRLRGCSRGVAALEFALVLPIMAMLYLGVTELSFAYGTFSKLTWTSRTVADLTGRMIVPLKPTTAMDDVFNASLGVMQPYNASQIRMVVSSIIVLPTGQMSGGKPVLQGIVCESQARPTGTATLTKGAVVPVDPGYDTANTLYVRSDVTMPYQAIFGAEILKMITGADSITLKASFPWSARNVAPGVTACP